MLTFSFSFLFFIPNTKYLTEYGTIIIIHIFLLGQNEVLHKASSTEKQNMMRQTHELLGNGEAG